ncbi:indolepyruvate ferredoxin oxidoreductase family protein [Serratia nematodiphila]|uniref:indolepyruvate ferredoxin oxidoreductase family protein n=1 Tax=Serratia nematodiphila TaxID=458197 RepID=UPI0011D8DA92|nr:indolepyruvate ferredoxin oxidoreductase family protein [Serratia nematodiphila]TXE57045.1 indolepyruvate ferredoxin oxidoreductase family protein [Serratia nematodiphila]
MGKSSISHASSCDNESVDDYRQIMTGTQAIIKFSFMQHQLDCINGINSAGFISGYRGSPLAKLDIELWKEKDNLAKENITFTPGVNEELAATAVWGSQQVNLFEGARYDGVFGIWYGKNAGVDRCGDVFRHANSAGTSKFGGVVVIAGDDPYAQSSSLAAQSEQIFQAVMMPVLSPSSVQEILLYGLHGINMSRFSGCWVAMKIVSDIAESTAIVSCNLNEYDFIIPNSPYPGVERNICWPDTPKDQDKRLIEHKISSAILYAKENNINQIVINSPEAKIGIISSGRAYLDVCEALNILNKNNSGKYFSSVGVYKIGMVWPLDPEQIIQFSKGFEIIIVIEEKRDFIESQVKSIIYNTPMPHPYIIGKHSESGNKKFLSETDKITPEQIYSILLSHITNQQEIIPIRSIYYSDDTCNLPEKIITNRLPHYCSGCPHSISTKVPKDSMAFAGIGCHYMAKWIYPGNKTFSQMGGEGVAWIGITPFTDTNHVFSNLGDGTYFHSGILAIRAAIAAKVNITYKILYNHVVAMTGGQEIDGDLTAINIIEQLYSEGVRHIAIVTDNVAKYAEFKKKAKNVRILNRGNFSAIQQEFSKINGVSIIVYDQSCAIKKRRVRQSQPDVVNTVILINEDVCDECGDCSSKSNCISVVPVETEFGIKRKIDSSSCNQDISCVNGFCPSFVTIKGKKKKTNKIDVMNDALSWDLKEPIKVNITEPYNIIISGVGGTGVTTMSALLSAAAFSEGLGVLTLDMTGIAQKNGAVWSHIRLAPSQDLLFSPVINEKETQLLLGLDIVTTSLSEVLSRTDKSKTIAVINSAKIINSEFVFRCSEQSESGDINRHPDFQFPQKDLVDRITKYIDVNNIDFIDFNFIVTRLMGEDKSVNVFILGFAYQKGWLPISELAILKAIEIGSFSNENYESFIWGRRTATNYSRIERLIEDNYKIEEDHIKSKNIDEIISRREKKLISYQGINLSNKYREKVAAFTRAERQLKISSNDLSKAVARYYFKVLYIKDEYEVARLLSEDKFLRKIKDQFEGDYELNFYLSIPLLIKYSREAKKIKFGSWILPFLKFLTKLKVLRSTPLNPFGYSYEHRMSLQWKLEYEEILTHIENNLNSDNYHLAIALANLPDLVRGYGLVKERYIYHAMQQKEKLLIQFNCFTSAK